MGYFGAMKTKNAELLGSCPHVPTNEILYNGAPAKNYRVLICDSCLRTKLFSKNILKIKRIDENV